VGKGRSYCPQFLPKRDDDTRSFFSTLHNNVLWCSLFFLKREEGQKNKKEGRSGNKT
jgi:hypothetical protein